METLMGRKRKNEIGNRYNHLVVLELDHIDDKSKQGFYLCECDCGNKKVIGIDSLRTGSTKACGCLRGKKNKWNYLSTEHQDLYKRWNRMKSRCYNHKDIGYSNYGGRGIKVCDEWMDNFDNFAEWSYNNGYKVGLEIDRINNSEDYKPSNCRYVSATKNRRNKRTTQRYEYQGKMMPLGEIAEINGIAYKVLWQRLNRDGLDLKDAIY